MTHLFLNRDNKYWIYSNEREWPNNNPFVKDRENESRANWLSTATFDEVERGEVEKFKDYICDHVPFDVNRPFKEVVLEGIIIPKECFEVKKRDSKLGGWEIEEAFFVSPSKPQEPKDHYSLIEKLTAGLKIIAESRSPSANLAKELLTLSVNYEPQDPENETQEELLERLINLWHYGTTTEILDSFTISRKDKYL